MKTTRLTTSLKRIALVALMAAVMPLSAQAEEFKPLFNGTDLNGWSGSSEIWSVKDGIIVGDTHPNGLSGKNQFLSTADAYSDFVLKVKVKMENGNSGIQFRAMQKLDYVVTGYQADVADSTKPYFGMLYEEGGRGIMPYWKEKTEEELAAIKAAVKFDDWNEYVITCKGDHIKMVLNGFTVLDLVDPEGAKEGIIALQLHTGPAMRVFYKDLEIKEMEKVINLKKLNVLKK